MSVGPLNFPGSPLSNIQGAVTVSNDHSHTDLKADDSADTTGVQYTLGVDSLTTSVSAAISFNPAELETLDVQTGSGGNQFAVTDTPAGVSTFLTSGSGDLVAISRTTGPLQILDSDASAQVDAAPTALFEHLLVRGALAPGAVTGALADPRNVDVYTLPVFTPGTFTAQLVATPGSLLNGCLDLTSTVSFIDYTGLAVGGGGPVLTMPPRLRR